MKVFVALTMLALTGCYESGRFSCKDPVLDITSAQEVDCKSIEADVALAKQLMESSHIISNSFDRFKGTTVFIRSEPWGWKDGDEWVGGITYPGQYIQSAGLFYDLLHELIHVRDEQDLNATSMWHTGWETNGNYYVAEIFNQHVVSVPGKFACTATIPDDMKADLEAAGLFEDICPPKASPPSPTDGGFNYQL